MSTAEPPHLPPGAANAPYRMDVTITLPSGGLVRLIGTDLGMAGMREMLDLIQRAVPDD